MRTAVVNGCAMNGRRRASCGEISSRRCRGKTSRDERRKAASSSPPPPVCSPCRRRHIRSVRNVSAARPTDSRRRDVSRPAAAAPRGPSGARLQPVAGREPHLTQNMQRYWFSGRRVFRQCPIRLPLRVNDIIRRHASRANRFSVAAGSFSTIEFSINSTTTGRRKLFCGNRVPRFVAVE